MRCFSVLGPSQSGKTTLLEHLASLEGQSPDRTPIGSDFSLVQFDYLGEHWGAIDCPGSVELIYDAQAALLASDAAIVCVDPNPEHAVLAAPFLRVVEASGTPTLLFINRMDEAEAPVRDIVAALQDYASHVIVLRQVPIRAKGKIVGAVDLISERAWEYHENQPSSLIEIPDSVVDREIEARAGLLEELAELDDWLLEELIDDRQPATGKLFEICSKALTENAVIPAFFGSASHGNGVTRLMKALRHECPAVDELRLRLSADLPKSASPPLAVSFHADHRKHVGKVVFLRALADGLAAGTRLGGEKLGSFIEMGGAGAASGVETGGVAGVVKSDHLAACRSFTADTSYDPPDWAKPPMPMVARVLLPTNSRDEAKLSGVLARLAEDEPGLVMSKEDGSGRPVAHVQGPVHLRNLCDRLNDVFGVPVETRGLGTLYRETIRKPVDTHYRHRKQTGGAGQFADVHLSVEPRPRGEGFAFSETVKGGAIPRNFMPAIEAGAQDAMTKGPMGFPVVDVSVTVTDGQYHSVDSNDFAFRTAGKLGVAQALAEAGPVLLQPIEQVVIHLPSIYSGALVQIVSGFRGQVQGFAPHPEAKGWDEFRALLPGSVIAELEPALRSATHGTGWYEVRFDHFEEIGAKEAERIISSGGGSTRAGGGQIAAARA